MGAEVGGPSLFLSEEDDAAPAYQLAHFVEPRIGRQGRGHRGHAECIAKIRLALGHSGGGLAGDQGAGDDANNDQGDDGNALGIQGKGERGHAEKCGLELEPGAGSRGLGEGSGRGWGASVVQFPVIGTMDFTSERSMIWTLPSFISMRRRL
jgi:hypothetical protein